MKNNDNHLEDYIVVSFSGGKDSTAMLLRMIELKEHIDEVVCCDTYKEFPDMYKHIDKVKELVEKNNIKFTMLKSDKTFDYLMFEHNPKRKNEKLIGKLGYSWAGSRNRWCTSKLKIDVINKYFNDLKSKHNVIQCIGIAIDEDYRLNRKSNQMAGLRYPLVEWGWSEKDCLDYCYSKGFKWNGLYELFDRVSCWCCPLQSLTGLKTLRNNFPNLWDELKDMDNRTWRKFRADYSVKEIEIKFDLEEKYLRENKSIRSKEFFKEFNRLREGVKK